MWSDFNYAKWLSSELLIVLSTRVRRKYTGAPGYVRTLYLKNQ
jgi:hypothetical protein